MSKIKIGIVNYLNTKPLLYGIEQSPIRNEIDLVSDYPSNIATMLLENRIDAGLVPVAIIPRLTEAHIITDYCIGCDGPVASVCVLSNVPMGQIKKLLIDYQSRTSANLIKILVRKYWKIDVEMADTQADYRDQIKDSTAGLVIGDRCLEYRSQVPYVYDLGEAWKDFTGLPFVFAAWISNKKLPERFITAFNEANKLGVSSIEKIIADNILINYNSRTYFTKNVSYLLDEQKRKGLEMFLMMLEEESSVVRRES